MTNRATFEAAAHAALTRYDEAIAKGTWRTTARNQAVDDILKEADRYALGAAAMKRRQQATARALDAALARVMQDA